MILMLFQAMVIAQINPVKVSQGISKAGSGLEKV